uniref:TAP binding protein like n=1 Tax=Myripristis murdjan TaxID=586833 RepID=A0A667X0Y8_9TELE
MIEVLLLGYLMAHVYAEGGADVVLSCSLVEEGVGGVSLFTRTPATLVLRDVAVPSDELSDTLTPFIPPTTPDPDLILFEAKASSTEIPNGEVLLHADCDEKEVMCEISRYFPHGSQDSKEPAYFFVSLSIEGDGLGASLVLQTLMVESDQTKGAPLIQNKLGLPLSQSGSLLTEVVFLVFSHAKAISAPLKGDVLLNCGFRQQEMPPTQEVTVEWRLQHRGTGRKVLDMRSRPTDAEEHSVVNAERKGSSVDAGLLVGEGNASMTLTKLKVSDEGTYICTVGVGLFHAQQVIQLHIIQPPRVSLSEEKLVYKAESPQTLSCLCSHYYPLDVQVCMAAVKPTYSYWLFLGFLVVTVLFFYQVMR